MLFHYLVPGMYEYHYHSLPMEEDKLYTIINIQSKRSYYGGP